MKLFNSKLADVIEFREVTYHENVMVRKGLCEVTNIYSITELKRRGFVEVAEPTEKILEEVKIEIPIKKETSVKKKIEKSKKVKKVGRPKKSGVKT